MYSTTASVISKNLSRLSSLHEVFSDVYMMLHDKVSPEILNGLVLLRVEI
ncbi:hypothetical protein NMYAN_30034 [Nitrosomonas nitrosa]|uniref:Uncharacterized protein n=1 Tax=Nitrosomonas nitrosa TaxID=52442 RepID=A0A8H9D9R0_9PROT|nr:hypothetical protein NMYAN_30034 [Nitrosomonas nitrosa]